MAKLALEAGASQVSVSQAYACGPNKKQDEVRVQLASPTAARFLESLMMAAAFLFTPFLAQVLAVGYGILTRQGRLALQGVLALAVSTALAFASGVIVAAISGGPLQYDQFSSLLSNLAISLIIGLVAGLATGDVVGQREFIGLAAAAQYATYPVWFGIQVVLGFPDAQAVGERLLTFGVNVGAILIVSVAVYAALRYQARGVQAYTNAARQE